MFSSVELVALIAQCEDVILAKFRAAGVDAPLLREGLGVYRRVAVEHRLANSRRSSAQVPVQVPRLVDSGSAPPDLTWLPAAAAAALIGVSPGMVRRLCREHRFGDAGKRDGDGWLVEENAAAAYRDSRRRRSAVA
jgi:hypothetical protein